MEEEKKDLEILQKGIEYLESAMQEFIACDLVSEIEYEELGNFIEALRDRKMNKEISLENYRTEEI
jgi:hypothetical protein